MRARTEKHFCSYGYLTLPRLAERKKEKAKEGKRGKERKKEPFTKIILRSLATVRTAALRTTLTIELKKGDKKQRWWHSEGGKRKAPTGIFSQENPYQETTFQFLLCYEQLGGAPGGGQAKPFEEKKRKHSCIFASSPPTTRDRTRQARLT